jgi:hypothetical protein
VYGDTPTYSKLGERIHKYYQYQLFVWNPLNKEHNNVREINTVHTYINGKPGAPSVHFVFRLLATAKEQTKGASIDERNARAGEKPEQVWGFIATKPRLIYK